MSSSLKPIPEGSLQSRKAITFFMTGISTEYISKRHDGLIEVRNVNSSKELIRVKVLTPLN